MERSWEFVAGRRGNYRACGAYVTRAPEHPLAYTRPRVEDAKLQVVVTRAELASRVGGDVATLAVEETLGEATGNLNIKVKPEQLAYIMYTSGSTGRPKGAM